MPEPIPVPGRDNSQVTSALLPPPNFAPRILIVMQVKLLKTLVVTHVLILICIFLSL